MSAFSPEELRGQIAAGQYAIDAGTLAEAILSKFADGQAGSEDADGTRRARQAKPAGPHSPGHDAAHGRRRCVPGSREANDFPKNPPIGPYFRAPRP